MRGRFAAAALVVTVLTVLVTTVARPDATSAHRREPTPSTTDTPIDPPDLYNNEPAGCFGEASTEPTLAGFGPTPTQQHPPRVVVLGDRQTVQSTPALRTALPDDAVILATCHGGIRALLATPQFAELVANPPAVVVLAFGPDDLAPTGTPDLTQLDHVLGLVDSALNATDMVGCRVIVNVDTNNRAAPDPTGALWQAFAYAFNDRLGSTNPAGAIDHRRHPNIELVDWDGTVSTHPALTAGLNLTPTGADIRARAIAEAVATCPNHRPSTVTTLEAQL